MNQYLIDTKFAAESLIVAIYDEEMRLEEMNAKLSYLKQKHDFLYADFSSSDMNEDFNEFQVQDKFVKMAKVKQEGDILENEIKILNTSISNKKISIDSLSMSLLQIAKQGISTVRNTLSNCPSGRNIGSEILKNVIWQARNQAIHCEEGNPHPPVKQCFSNLTNDFGVNFDITINPTHNKSKEVIDLLKWKEYKNYELDMISLLG